jgi:hypothetical protein
MGMITMSSINSSQIVVKQVDEEYLSWSRTIRFDWVPDGSTVAELAVVKIYYSEFDGYEIDWHKSDASQGFRSLVEGMSETEFADMLDNLAYSFQKNQ